VSSTSITAVYLCGDAALALWLLVRFPSVGPRKLRSAILAAALSALLQWPVLMLLDAVRATSGRAVAIVFVGLPLLTTLFWSSGCLVRAAVAATKR
jgi:hypothetical protein